MSTDGNPNSSATLRATPPTNHHVRPQPPTPPPLLLPLPLPFQLPVLVPERHCLPPELHHSQRPHFRLILPPQPRRFHVLRLHPPGPPPRRVRPSPPHLHFPPAGLSRRILLVILPVPHRHPHPELRCAVFLRLPDLVDLRGLHEHLDPGRIRSASPQFHPRQRHLELQSISGEQLALCRLYDELVLPPGQLSQGPFYWERLGLHSLWPDVRCRFRQLSGSHGRGYCEMPVLARFH